MKIAATWGLRAKLRFNVIIVSPERKSCVQGFNNFKNIKKPELNSSGFWQGRRDCVETRPISIDFYLYKNQSVSVGFSFSHKIFLKKIFYGSPNNSVRILSPQKTKNCVRRKPYTVFGRGDAIRTRNRRFWRPRLYR